MGGEMGGRKEGEVYYLRVFVVPLFCIPMDLLPRPPRRIGKAANGLRTKGKA
jgi:hypothetical protein